MSTPALRETVSHRFRALRHRNFRVYWSGQLVSLVGTWMQSVAQGWLMHRLTGSPMMLGLLGFAQFAPVLLLSLWAGVAADRMDKRRLLYLTQGTMLVQALGLALVVSLGVVQPWMVLAFAALYGTANSIDMPTRQSFVVELVGKEDLPNAIALNSTAFNSARVVGPALAGVLVARVGEQGCFWINAVSYVAVLWGLALIRLPRWQGSRGRAGSTLAEGVRYARGVSSIRHLLVLLGLTAGLGFQYLVLLPVYARDLLRAGAEGYGLLVTAFGLGALLAALRLTGPHGRWDLRRNLQLGLAASGLGLAIFAWSRSLPLSLAMGFLAGFGLIVYIASTNTLLQITTEDRFRGRVMSLYTLMFVGTAPLGALATGAVAQRFGAPVATTCSAAILLLGALWVTRRLQVLARQEGRTTEAAPIDRIG